MTCEYPHQQTITANNNGRTRDYRLEIVDTDTTHISTDGNSCYSAAGGGSCCPGKDSSECKVGQLINRISSTGTNQEAVTGGRNNGCTVVLVSLTKIG